jgi:hypothetical protein
MAQSATAIELPKIPKDKDYEDYLCSYLQSGGLYVERSIIYREVEELLELDILTTDFRQKSATNNLIEIKGGNWGFSDIFKIRGWLSYLNYEKGSFIVQESRPSISYFAEKAKDLKIDLIDNSDLSKTKETLKRFLQIEPEDADIETIRFAYLLERKLLQKIKTSKKANPETKSYRCLDDYFFKINSGSFFSRDPIRRMNQLFNIYIKYKNITARICHEINGGDFEDENITDISKQCFDDIFYKANDSILQVSLYVEHIARITILKCAIEHLIDKLKGNYSGLKLNDIFEFLILPNTIKAGLTEIIKDKYFYLYPRFWQYFTYVFGGFILTDLKDKEMELLSRKTGIPIEEIPNAFDSFNKLFPRQNGWFLKFPNSGIQWHSLFPIAFSGIGANYRRLIYTKDDSYAELVDMLAKDKTILDLTKWNNLAYNILK